MSEKDVSIMIKTEDDTAFYIRLGDMEDSERQTLLEQLKQGNFKRAIKFMSEHEKSHFFNRGKEKRTKAPERLEQSSLGQTEDFGKEPDIETVYQKAREGDPKSLRLVGAWANQGDKQAKIFLIQLSQTPERTRERVIIP